MIQLVYPVRAGTIAINQLHAMATVERAGVTILAYFNANFRAMKRSMLKTAKSIKDANDGAR